MSAVARTFQRGRRNFCPWIGNFGPVELATRAALLLFTAHETLRSLAGRARRSTGRLRRRKPRPLIERQLVGPAPFMYIHYNCNCNYQTVRLDAARADERVARSLAPALKERLLVVDVDAAQPLSELVRFLEAGGRLGPHRRRLRSSEARAGAVDDYPRRRTLARRARSPLANSSSPSRPPCSVGAAH
jgi:hypothetical protein